MDLKQFTVFSSLSDRELQTLETHVYRKTIPRGESLDLTSPNRIHMVRHGLVKVLVENNVEYVKYVHHKGDIFHLLPLLGKCEARELQLVAVEDTIIYSVDASPLQNLMAANPRFMMDILCVVAQRIQQADNHIRFLHLRKAKDRLLGFLSLYVSESGKREGEYLLNTDIFTHQELAEISCTSRQTVATYMNEWRRDGTLVYEEDYIGVRANVVDTSKEINMS